MLDAMQDDNDISIAMDFLQDEIDCESDVDSLLSLEDIDEVSPLDRVSSTCNVVGLGHPG